MDDVDGYDCYIIVIGVLLFDHLYHTSFTHPALLTIAICSIPLHSLHVYGSLRLRLR